LFGPVEGVNGDLVVAVVLLLPHATLARRKRTRVVSDEEVGVPLELLAHDVDPVLAVVVPHLRFRGGKRRSRGGHAVLVPPLTDG
jgi:hypothetical protein